MWIAECIYNHHSPHTSALDKDQLLKPLQKVWNFDTAKETRQIISIRFFEELNQQLISFQPETVEIQRFPNNWNPRCQ